MRHQKSGRKLSRRTDQRKALLMNLAVSLIKHGKIKTTDAKAKEVRPFVERMVTFAKRGDLHARRIVLARIGDADAVKKLFEELGPQYATRMGGYTRIIKLGFRHGDNSPVSLIEFVSEEETKKAAPKKKSSKAKPSNKAEVKAEEAVVEEVVEESAAEETVTEEAPAEAVETEAVEEAAVEEADAKAEEAAPAEKKAPEEASADAEEKPADDKNGDDK
jgi:large subunit ribosomal protein L17